MAWVRNPGYLDIPLVDGFGTKKTPPFMVPFVSCFTLVTLRRRGLADLAVPMQNPLFRRGFTNGMLW